MRMLNPSEITYFSLLRQAIYQGAKCATYGVQDTVNNAQCTMHNTRCGVEDGLMQIAHRQGTAPLIADQLLKTDFTVSPTFTASPELQLQLKQVCYRNMQLQQEMLQVLKKAWSALTSPVSAGERGLGIEACLLKGFGLASLYPQPHLRQWGDIDIYVGPKGYHTAAEVLRTTFPDCPCFEEEAEYYKHWNIDVGNTAIEAHRVSVAFTHPRDARLWRTLEQKGLIDECRSISDSVLSSVSEAFYYTIPEAKFNVLFVFLHSWHHFTESRSAKMQQLCDLALLLRGTDPLECALEEGKHVGSVPVMETYLRRNLRRLRLTAVWQQYAYIMVKYLGLPAEMCPLYKESKRIERKAESLLEMILEQKSRRQRQPAPKCVMVRKLHTLRSKIADSLSLWSISPTYAMHDMWGKILDGVGRTLRGEVNRKWE